MKYGDPVHKVLRLLESENINPGNLLIGQTVDVKVIDARKAEFLRPMMIGEFYPDGSVLLKDELTQETIVLQFQWDTNTEGLLYTGESDFGVKYELEINRDLMSNESITKLTESIKLNEAAKLKPFTGSTYGYDVMNGPNPGEKAMIAEGDNSVLVLSASEDGNYYIEVIIGEDDDNGSMVNTYDSYSTAKSAATSLLGILDKEDNEVKKFLKSKGFENLY